MDKYDKRCSCQEYNVLYDLVIMRPHWLSEVMVAPPQVLAPQQMVHPPITAFVSNQATCLSAAVPATLAV